MAKPLAPALIPLSDRGLLAISGPDVKPFLQGMVTCDVEKLTPKQSLYGAHLTAQGRFLHDFFLVDLNGLLVLDCHKEHLMTFAKNLYSFQMRFDIAFEDLSDDYDIFADLTPTSTPLGHTKQTKTGVIFTDPRLGLMGQRLIAKKGVQQAPDPLADYHAHRINHCIPDGAFDALQGKTIAGELCLEFLNGVDYEKGCYLGQEMTARTHFRNPPKKRLVAVAYKGKAPPLGAAVKAGNLPIGHVFSCENGKGIGILRTAKAFEKGATITSEDISLNVKKPAWAQYSVE